MKRGPIVITILLGVSLSTAAKSAPPTYEKDVRPIFARHCIGCHGKQQKAELDLRTPASILKGAESGAVIDRKKPAESLLWEAVHDRRMPPPGRPKLSPKEIETIRGWVLAGSKFKSVQGTTSVNRINQHTILPILRLRCTVCHGRQSQSAMLDLRSRASILKGGKSGPAMVLGHPEQSLILKRIHSGDMPPKSRLAAASVKPMTDAEIQLLTNWIRASAPQDQLEPDVASTKPDPLVSDNERKFWSFHTPRRPNVPRLASPRIENAVDAFVLRKLKSTGLSFSTTASRLTLIRRATFDLTGLPPAPQDVADFLRDQAPGAYDRLLDRLLASPRYGERWGRYWLDVAGYSDSEGGQHADRVRPEAYRYRDYVIRAFNRDKPYDRFLLEQIAGDELADYRNAKVITPDIYDNLVATGFLRMAPDSTYAGITAFVPDRLEIIDDEIEVLTSAVMGLTIRCARCHSHKFDPIPQRDYYRLAAVFKGALDEHDWLEPTKKRYLPHVLQGEQDAWKQHEAKLDAEVAELNRQVAVQRRQLRQKHKGKLQDTQLVKLNPAFGKLKKQTAAQINAIRKRSKPRPKVRALWDRGEPTPTYILKRGNYLTPGRLVGPGVPSVLTNGRKPLAVKAPFPGVTGRRLAFAKWLTRSDHPLTARVIVNRIWKHHFGRGIVASLDNFGRAGARPSHPELLDWLAVEFVKSGWSIKALHRLLMASTTYRQTSSVSETRLAKDPENRWFSRMPLKRMEGEILRDALLHVSGRLNLRSFGPADSINSRADRLVLSAGQQQAWRRTIYVLQRRTARLTILDNFDLPQMNPNCVERSSSIVAPQALHMLNNRRIFELSKFFAERIEREAGSDPGQQIQRIYRLAYGRSPNQRELQVATRGMMQLRRDWMEKLNGREVRIPAQTHLWIRKVKPNQVWEKDLISVWSSAKELRYGLVEFDVSSVSAEAWKAARLELGALNLAAIKQTASIIPPGIGGLTWNKYHESKARHRVSLQGFGRIVNGKDQVGKYTVSQWATKQDLEKLDAARSQGRVALVLMAVEDGKSYWRDWDDGSRGKLPTLVLRLGKSDPREAARRALQNVCHAFMNSAGFLYID